MKRIILMLTVAAMVVALSMSALTALAASPSEEECENRPGATSE